MLRDRSREIRAVRLFTPVVAVATLWAVRERSPVSRSSLTFGTLFVALGVLLLLDRGGLADAGSIIAGWWPSVVVLAGVAQVVTRPRNLVGGAMLTTIGGVLLLWTLGLTDVLGLLWPLVLIGLGLWVLTRQARPSSRGARPSRIVPPGEQIVVVFSDRDVRAPAAPFGGQAVTAMFGDLDLDLLDARLDGRVSMPVTAVFGDVDLEVPADWRVTVSGPELLGDVTLSTPYEPGDGAPELHLKVVCIFGDIKVGAREWAAASSG